MLSTRQGLTGLAWPPWIYIAGHLLLLGRYLKNYNQNFVIATSAIPRCQGLERHDACCSRCRHDTYTVSRAGDTPARTSGIRAGVVYLPPRCSETVPKRPA
nr:hypothetical protein CFP56_03075 [Quercus suber]